MQDKTVFMFQTGSVNCEVGLRLKKELSISDVIHPDGSTATDKI